VTARSKVKASVWEIAMTVLAPSGALAKKTQTPKPSPPSTRGYWLGGLLTAAAVVGAIVWAVVTYFDYQHQIDHFRRMTVPGVATVQLADRSTQVLYFEAIRGAATPTLAELGVTVTDANGAAVTVTRFSGALSYDVPDANNRVGHAVAEFHPAQPGRYVVNSSPTGDMTGTLAVGGDIVWNIAPHAIGAAALFLLGGGAGIALLVVTGVRRSRGTR
jgi:hypothetical protein